MLTMDLEKEVRRLKRIVAVLCVIAIVAVVWVASKWITNPLIRVHVVRDGDKVQIRSVSDGPYIVTHLTVSGRDTDSESEKRTAALSEPIACIDSGGLLIEDITKLDWRDISGSPAEPPSHSQRITALLMRPEYISMRE
jgi:hypothetical protein